MNSNDTSDRCNNKSFVYNLLTGGFAGCIAKTVIAPLDRAKIIFQYTYIKEGFTVLWRGNTATLTRIYPYAAIQFSAHEKYKQLLRIDSTDLSHFGCELRLRRFTAGCGAGLTSVACTYPLDFSRARMAITSSSKYANLPDAICKVCREEGWRTLYCGFGPAILGCIPYTGIAFLTFESLKDARLSFLAEETGIRPKRLNALENVCFGAFAGTLGQTLSYPLDVVRRRMQTGRVIGHPEYSESIIKTLRLVLKHEGFFSGLYKGVSLNWIKSPISSGISFTVFHQLQHLLHLN